MHDSTHTHNKTRSVQYFGSGPVSVPVGPLTPGPVTRPRSAYRCGEKAAPSGSRVLCSSGTRASGALGTVGAQRRSLLLELVALLRQQGVLVGVLGAVLEDVGLAAVEVLDRLVARLLHGEAEPLHAQEESPFAYSMPDDCLDRETVLHVVSCGLS